MISAVRGTLVSRTGDRVVVETAGGVSYEIAVPLGVLERLAPEGRAVELQTVLVVREDGWALYGFDGELERTIFQRLLGASGVGPRLALALVSTLGGTRVVSAVREGDIAALCAVPGVGRKTADRLVLELKDRVQDMPLAEAARVVRAAGVPLVKPFGGHAIYLDARALLPHIPPLEYPGQSLAVALYREGGIRGCEIGTVMFGRHPDGSETPAAMDLVRLAIPRRTYTQSHIDYVIEVVLDVFATRKGLRGFRIIEEAPVLRHFTAKFEMLEAS